MSVLSDTAKALVTNFKGILAADESQPTIQKRFEGVGIENSEDNRRAYRELLFTAPGVEEYLSGVILFDETLRQKTTDGKPLPQLLSERGIIPGIKVDKGKVDLPNFSGESVTQGLDDLGKRLEEYKSLGAQFTKWRAVFAIGEGFPTQPGVEANITQLCLFAALSQAAGLVPIVEPEVLMDGGHDLARCEEVTRAVLSALFVYLQDFRLDLSGLLLKPNMIINGEEASVKATPNEIAQATVTTLKRCVPAGVPGIVFLSGGQAPQEATVNLNAINLVKADSPWELSFSFGRALQEPVLKTWVGKAENKDQAQKVFLETAKTNWLARQGKYES